MPRKPIFVACVAVGCLAVPALAAEPAGSWAGKRVMVARWDAELKTGTRVLGRVPLGAVLEVSRVNGPWLWIQSQRAWIQASDVVLYDQAIDHFTAAIARNPSSDAYHRRAAARIAMSRFDEALADLDEAIRRDGNNVSARNDRGNLLRKLGKPDQALADFNRILATGVRHPAVYVNRGLVWHDKGDYDRALADYNQAIALDAKFAPAWEAGGSARQARGELRKAIENFRRAIELDPKFARAHNNLAWLLATCADGELRDGKQAVEHATKACELVDFRDAEYLDTLAAAHAESGQFEQAVMRAKEAIEKAAPAQKAIIQKRLERYEARKPYREPKAGS